VIEVRPDGGESADDFGAGPLPAGAARPSAAPFLHSATKPAFHAAATPSSAHLGVHAFRRSKADGSDEQDNRFMVPPPRSSAFLTKHYRQFSGRAQ
jgi:hypothetical protein